MSCHLRKTKYLVERCKNELKSHKEYEFVPNKTSEDIGQILTKEIDIIDEKRPVGIIRFVIDNFSEFKYSKEYCQSTASTLYIWKWRNYSFHFFKNQFE